MRLTELEATFVLTAEDNSFSEVPTGTPANGVMFKCPGCWKRHGGSAGTHMVVVWFANPIGGAPVAAPHWEPRPRWYREGETLHELTLQPSINIPNDWHGWVAHGEAD